jgi:hypothetical protein
VEVAKYEVRNTRGEGAKRVAKKAAETIPVRAGGAAGRACGRATHVHVRGAQGGSNLRELLNEVDVWRRRLAEYRPKMTEKLLADMLGGATGGGGGGAVEAK